MRISDWSSDVCSSDLDPSATIRVRARLIRLRQAAVNPELLLRPLETEDGIFDTGGSGDLNIAELAVADLIRNFSARSDLARLGVCRTLATSVLADQGKILIWSYFLGNLDLLRRGRSEKHTSELQSLMRTSYAVFCLKKKNRK